MSANDITLYKAYIDNLDAVYQDASVTAVLDGANELASMGQNAGEMLIPKYDMDGLADYHRTDANGYAEGGVSLTFETKKCNYDRGRVFNINDMDNVESNGIAFGKLSSEFIRTKVAPEIDAVRLATYAGKAGGHAAAALATGADWISALTAASLALDDEEVPTNDRVLFIQSSGLKAVNNMQTIDSKAIFGDFAAVVKAPKKRFYSAIDLQDGRTKTDTVDETKGGFKPTTDAKSLNFLVVSKSAVIQYMKNVVNKVINPTENQDDDKWKFFYHPYGINEVYDNKVKGIYYHSAA
jgi:hypothetical protein